MTVLNDRGCGDAGSQNSETSHGGEARLEERSAGQCHQGKGLQNILRRRDGGCRRSTTIKLMSYATRNENRNQLQCLHSLFIAFK